MCADHDHGIPLQFCWPDKTQIAEGYRPSPVILFITHSNNRQLTQTLNLTFLYVTVSTLNPTVGIVVTDWPSFSLYRIATHELRIVIQMLVTKIRT